MPNTAQRSAEYEILSLLRRRFCRWRRFFLHGVREESADCGRWSEKAKRETRKVAKAYGKEAQAPVSQATEKHEKPVGEHMGGAFHPKDDGYDGYYRALTQCVLTPAKPQGVRAILSARQKELLLWLTEAGLRLTTAELVFLTEHHVAPQINLLGDRNRQNLTETIYTQETIFDNILEAQMEHAAVRDEVVSALLRLL